MKITPHWLSIAAERVAAGEPEDQVLADYGWMRELVLDPKESIIQLSKDYRLCNERAYVLRKYTGINVSNGSQVHQFVANWPTFTGALYGLVERQIKAAGPCTLQESVNACERASQTIKKALSGDTSST